MLTLGMPYIETSAKDDVNVAEAFLRLAKQMLARKHEDLNRVQEMQLGASLAEDIDRGRPFTPSSQPYLDDNPKRCCF